MWKYLEPIVEEFHRDTEKYYMNLYGLLHENLLLQKFEGDITVTNILLPEIAVSSFDTYIYAKWSQMIAKMIVVTVIIQPYQNERL